MLKKALKYILLVLVFYLFIGLFTPYNEILMRRSIENQIIYLAGILDRGYDDELQLIYPEGKVFSNSLLALSVIEYCDNNNIADKKYSNIIDDCIRRLQSQSALEAFDENMDPRYGMFYNGWSNYVNVKYRSSRLFHLSDVQNEVDKDYRSVLYRLTEAQEDSIRLLDSYYEMSWPADNLIGLISIEDKDLQGEWLEAILSEATHESGLIHHAGGNSGKVRGSSTAMITFCLAEIGYDSAEAYNEKFKELFIDDYMGVQLVRENENASNDEDVDSGPVILAYGASATIMNIKTQARLSNNSRLTWAIFNAISLPINFFQKKYFLLKKQPMYDLFMLWGSVQY